MSWTTPTTRSFNDLITAGIWNTDLVANLIELRGGGLSISGQGANKIPYAISGTQLGTSSGLTFDGSSLTIAPTAKFYLDSGVDSYIKETSNDRIEVFTGGALSFGVTGSAVYVIATGRVYLDGGSDTYLSEAVANNIDLVAGGTTSLRVAATGATLSGDLNVGTTSNFSWVSKSHNTVYQAASDGFVIFSGGLESTTTMTIYSDASNPPTTARAYTSVHAAGVDVWFMSIMSPVKKGDYWKATSTDAPLVNFLYWVPMGVNG